MEKPLQNREGVSEEMADKRKPVLSPEQHLSSNMTLHHPGDDELRERALEIINSDTDLLYLEGVMAFRARLETVHHTLWSSLLGKEIASLR